MELYILNQNYEQIALISEADSILWAKKFNDIGECEIYLPCDTINLQILKIGNYIFRYDDDMFCKIESIEIKTDIENGDYIIATATDICKILSGRIIRWQTIFNGTVKAFIEKILDENVVNPEQPQRKIDNFIIDNSGLTDITDKIEISVIGEDLLQLIIKTCKSYKIGFRVYYNINIDKLVFKLYKGIDKSSILNDEYIEFSPEFANILSTNYKYDDSALKNLAYVGYKSENSDEIKLFSLMLPNVSEPHGEARREIYIDGTSISRNIEYSGLIALFPTATKNGNTYYITKNGEQIAVATTEGAGEEEKITITDYTYNILIVRLGRNALYEHIGKESFNGELDTSNSYKYKIDYNVGDYCLVKNDYGISAAAQIVEVVESNDTENGYIVEPNFEYFN